MRLLIACSVLLFSPVLALADVKTDLARIEATLDKCQKANESNAGTKQCVWDAYQDADKLLNRTYQRMFKDWVGDDSDAAERKKRLVAAQRVWVVYRDAECSLEATEMLGGTGEGLVEGGCLYRTTADRTRQIEALMKQN